MTFVEFINETAYLGYVLGAVLVIVGVAVLVTLVTVHRRDDGYRPIGDAEPPPPRRSPFASNADTVIITGVGGVDDHDDAGGRRA